jgi:hypothetical protein
VEGIMSYDFQHEAQRIVEALNLKGASMTLMCALQEAFEAGQATHLRVVAPQQELGGPWTPEYLKGYAHGLNDAESSGVLQAVLDAINGTLDPSTQIADHPNVKFAQMQRLKLLEEGRKERAHE